MSIPLDRFYHYLDHSVDRDIIIYRWVPPGSKKLGELRPLRNYTSQELRSGVGMVCHDQEPLCLSLYNNATQHAMCQREYANYIGKSFPVESWPWDIDHALDSQIGVDLWDNDHDGMILLHSEPNSAEAQRAKDLGWHTVTIWSNAVIAQDWFRYACHDPQLQHRDAGSARFLIYSRAWTHSREYRLWFLDQLQHRDLLRHSTTRFQTQDQGIHYSDHEFQDHQWQCRPRQLELQCLPSQAPPWASADYDAADYQHTDIEIVLETVIDRVHLTEKTCRALACGQPFMLASGAGGLAFLRGHGFMTFDGVIDESYDGIQDAQQRLEAIQAEMLRLVDIAPGELLELRRRAHFNRQRFFSQQFVDHVITSFQRDLDHQCQLIGRTGTLRQRWQTTMGATWP